MKKTLKNIVLGTTIIGSLMASGCARKNTDSVENRRVYQEQEHTYVFSAKRVEITPHGSYSSIESITVDSYLPGYPEDIKLSKVYTKDDPEFKTFRAYLTVEQKTDPYRR